MARDLLRVENLRVAYGGVVAVESLDIVVPAGSTVALIGPNGAGKTSTMRAIGGQADSTGSISLNGVEISGWAPHKIARSGLAQVPQGRRLFPELTVVENLHLGAYGRATPERLSRIGRVMEMFPRLGERRNQRAGSLSGGEQQMLAIGRAIAADPLLIAMDEPSLGLAPIIVSEVFETIRAIGSEGTSILLVEQNATKALEASDYVYVLERGQVVFEGTPAQAKEDLDLVQAYMG